MSLQWPGILEKFKELLLMKFLVPLNSQVLRIFYLFHLFVIFFWKMYSFFSFRRLLFPFVGHDQEETKDVPRYLNGRNRFLCF